ncbi:MAG: ATP-binding protein [Clostridia bacterium]
MEELSLNILDITNNSVTAKATEILITIIENTKEDTFSIEISDNGCGMTKEFLEKVTDPFVTTRTTRKVGLGIPLFKMGALMTNGSFDIRSEVGKGTTTTAVFGRNHIDTPPLGDIAFTMITLITGSPNIEFIYTHKVDDKEFKLDTNEMKQILQSDDLNNPEVISFIKEFINDNLEEIGAKK